ncbi:zinc finger protein 600 [Folsomia candida]|uniref:zinc finger protein 600 n=1 Tax=Folsomia candida TaxID=158441 RepID=UPI000B8F3053|nr:zinc finger protein 600 [Folsomia candida]XP_021951619.1 zinc finger protein 600 [Folsomia candida]XP_035707065.1 zinc finger protein 600 [Folsomia candida]
MGGQPMFHGRLDTFPPMLHDRLAYSQNFSGGPPPQAPSSGQIGNSLGALNYEVPSRSIQHFDDRSCSPPPVEICPQCDNVYTTKRLLKQHISQVHGRGRSKIKCHICPKSFCNQVTLRNYVNLIHGKGGYPCTACGKRMSNQSNRIIHEINVCKVVWEKGAIEREGVKVYHCGFHGCDKVCGRFKDMERHMDIHVRDGKIRG